MVVLVTGIAGFIGFHVARRLLEEGHEVIGVDNLSPYYDVCLKQARLERLNQIKGALTFYKEDIADVSRMTKITKTHKNIDHVIHLAAQAGVRYSLENPYVYAQTNILGWITLLEACRCLSLKHCLYASSSSVYGANTKLPFAVEDRVDHPISLYAATKRSSELVAEVYTHLYGMPLSGLRFFTVYGPWGRPDMSAFIFTKAILEGSPLPVFNRGEMRRNFTYIDDITEGVLACLKKPGGQALYNLGNHRSEGLLDFIGVLENLLQKKAVIEMKEMQPGDVPETLADISASSRDFGFSPQTNIQEGLAHFVSWYKDYYHV